MSDFIESKIKFAFEDAKWKVVKYDDHAAHSNISNLLQPTKAVDFLGIHNNKKLYFVEVKNYRDHTQDDSTQEVLSHNAKELSRRIAVKVRDSIAGATNAARFSTNQSDFFNRVNEILLNNSEKIVVIAWIEFDERNILERKAKMSIWAQTLKQKMGWLHAVTVSVNSVNYGGNALPDAEISFVNT